MARVLLGVTVKRSFDRISVDGQLSTNDTVILMASGDSGVAVEPESEDDIPTAVADWRDQLAHPAPDSAGIPEPEPTVATPLAAFRPTPTPEPSMASDSLLIFQVLSSSG